MACTILTWSYVLVTYTVLESLFMMATNSVFVMMYHCNFDELDDFHGYIRDPGCIMGPREVPPSLILEPKSFYIIQLVSILVYILWVVGSAVILFQRCCCIEKLTRSSCILWSICCGAVLLLDLVVGMIVVYDYTRGLVLGPTLGLVLLMFKGGVGYILNFIALIVLNVAAKQMNHVKKTKIKAINTPTREIMAIYEDVELPPRPPKQEKSLPLREVVEEIQDRQQQLGTTNIQIHNVQHQQLAPVNKKNNQAQFENIYGADDKVVNDEIYETPHDVRRRVPYDDNIYEADTQQVYENAYEDHTKPIVPGYGGERDWRPPSSRAAHHIPQKSPRDFVNEAYENDYNTGPVNSSLKIKDDGDKDLVTKKDQYDLRPFSYMDPTFRPSDHLDIRSMEEHPVDTIQVLVKEVKELRKKQRERLSSSSTPTGTAERRKAPQSPGKDASKRSKTPERFITEV